MMGEELNGTEVTDSGLLGDRAYALVDRSDGTVASAKNPRKWPRLFDFRAALTDIPRSGTAMPPVRITLPDSAIASSEQPDIHAILSAVLKRPVPRMISRETWGSSARQPSTTRPTLASMRRSCGAARSTAAIPSTWSNPGRHTHGRSLL
jgi:uncharacterized protein YcbX